MSHPAMKTESVDIKQKCGYNTKRLRKENPQTLNSDSVPT